MIHPLQHLRANLRMLAHHFPLFIIQRPGFRKHVGGHNDLANIVQNGAKFQDGDLLGILIEGKAQGESQPPHTVNVTGRVRVARLDHVPQHHHGLEVSGARVEKLDGLAAVEARAHRLDQLPGVETA